MVRYHFRFYSENDFPRRVLCFSCIFGTLLHGELKYLCFLLQESGNPLNTYKHECDIRILSVWAFGHILWSSYPSSLPVCFQTIVLNPKLKQSHSTLMIFYFLFFVKISLSDKTNYVCFLRQVNINKKRLINYKMQKYNYFWKIHIIVIFISFIILTSNWFYCSRSQQLLFDSSDIQICKTHKLNSKWWLFLFGRSQKIKLLLKIFWLLVTKFEHFFKTISSKSSGIARVFGIRNWTFKSKVINLCLYPSNYIYKELKCILSCVSLSSAPQGNPTLQWIWVSMH